MNETASTPTDALPATADQPGAAAPAADQRGHVLVVEDEPGLAEVLALHLRASGYEPDVAHDGLEALYALDQVAPRAVLLDLHVPQVSGFRLIQLIKQRPETAQIPVLVITALSFQESEEAVRAGADDFITKPFLPEEVVGRVERAIARLG